MTRSWLRRPRHPAHLLRRVAAGLLAVAALGLALRPPPATPAPADAGPVTPVVVSAADLPAGVVLGTDDLVVVRLPTATVPDGTAATAEDLAGRTLAAPVRQGESVTDVRLVGAALWSAVPEGQVAAPVRLADLGVAALLRPGDRVDVLAGRPEAGVQVVASGALVLSVGSAGAEDDSAGLLVLAVTPGTAADLAGAATETTLTVTLGPP